MLALLHTYIFYPLILKIRAQSKSNNTEVYTQTDALPTVSVLMAAYNEELVIQQKIESILAADYPPHLLHFFIGSDNSNDRTNEIVASFAAKYPQIHFKNFTSRQGKPSIINQLHRWAKDMYKHSQKNNFNHNDNKNATASHIFIITDANVIFSKQLIFELVKHFKNQEIALVDSNIINVGMQSAGISKTENQYIKGEVQMKHHEGVIWQQTLGPLGGCFAIRANYFSEVPPKYLVDDFYIAMRVFEQGGRAINELNAICYEDVSHSIKEELRRKTRIGAGNFQNLVRFAALASPFQKSSLQPTLSFIFLSHKILRWFGFVFILKTWLSALALTLLTSSPFNLIFGFLFLSESVFLLLIPIAFYALQALGHSIAPIRAITYFNAANLAMLRGFFRFLKGVKSNVWQPTQRHTQEQP